MSVRFRTRAGVSVAPLISLILRLLGVLLLLLLLS
jgi:hypothetical protein